MPKISIFIKQYQSLVVSAAILVFSLVAVVFAVLPSVSTILALWEETKTIEDDVFRLEQKLAQLSALDEQQLRQQLSTVISAVPTDKSLPTVFSTVERVAETAGTSVSSMSIGGDTSLSTGSAVKLSASEKQLGTRTIPFTATVEGTLDAIQQFITTAPQIRRLLRIRTFAISFPENDRAISVTLQMDAFYQPSPAALGKSSQTLIPLTDTEQSAISRVSALPLAGGNEASLPPPLVGQTKPNPFVP